MIPISAVNLVLCIIILVLGCLGYKKGRSKVSLYIGIAFGLFGISHFMTLLGLQETVTGVLYHNENACLSDSGMHPV